MPKRDPFDGVAAAAIIVGLGVLVAAAVASGSTDRNAVFVQKLRAQLASRGLTLVGAELGRNSSGPLWVVTVQAQDAQVVVLHAPVAGNLDPLSDAVCNDVAQRVTHFLEHRAA
jgi:hypothetical protein